MPTPKGKKAPARTAAGELLTDLVLQVFKANTTLETAAPAVIQDDRINSPKWQILGAIRHEGKTAAQLGRELGMSRQITLWNARSLAGDGLIAFEANPNHQRAQLATLTDEGREVLEKLTANQVAWINELSGGFDQEQLSVALRTLQALCERLR
ncbi:Transcriptional activatory protein BadR [Pigmentiphaga humi]|uniref:Transcriptional activatory protein BadR n=1 Tax=Pigmentiphaga humi TaxID=2478468 RepID=A0A3P4B5B4_9BURK|nr:MarR family transcriptional regulator [Pigmentiphaga humi]VCU71489.1 Transcriptional activatory protein BadR [Pigmentiphaga humi]